MVTLARGYLGDEIVLYTTDGGTRETLEKGTIRGDAVFSAVDFSTGEKPWPIFNLQKEFNAPGKSPPLTAEFYTGWLTHWGENIATTDANSTAAALGEILAGKGSAVLYMAHGGTNFGFYNGANAGDDVLDYKPDLTSYDYSHFSRMHQLRNLVTLTMLNMKQFEGLYSTTAEHCFLPFLLTMKRLVMDQFTCRKVHFCLI